MWLKSSRNTAVTAYGGFIKNCNRNIRFLFGPDTLRKITHLMGFAAETESAKEKNQRDTEDTYKAFRQGQSTDTNKNHETTASNHERHHSNYL